MFSKYTWLPPPHKGNQTVWRQRLPRGSGCCPSPHLSGVLYLVNKTQVKLGPGKETDAGRRPWPVTLVQPTGTWAQFEHWFLIPVIIELSCVCTSGYTKKRRLKCRISKKGVRQETKGHLLSRTHLKCYSSINLVYISYCKISTLDTLSTAHSVTMNKKLNSAFSSSVSRTVNA